MSEHLHNSMGIFENEEDIIEGCDSNGSGCYLFREMLVENIGEWIQIHLDECSMQWKISKSSCSIIQLWRLFEDFEDINARS